MVRTGAADLEQAALRQALADGVGEPAIASWHYADTALVLGRSQRPSPELAARADRARIGLVERLSGGGAVITGRWMLSVTLLLPPAHPLARMSLPAGYRAIGEACRQAMHTLGLPTLVAPPVPAPRTAAAELDWACFASISHGELVSADGRKIVGLAQVRRRQGIAVCIGVLLARPPWELLVRVWAGRDDARLARQLEACTASCDEFVPASGMPSADQLATGLESALTELPLAA